MQTLRTPIKLAWLTVGIAGFFALNAWVTEGRMTGGGDFVSNNVLITFGTELHCDVTKGPNNLEINFGGNHFHLDALVAANCTLLGNPAPPQAPINTFLGTGFGSFNNTPGYHIDFVFQDNGEPGRADIADIVIKAPNGDIVLNAAASTLQSGNLQAHEETGKN